MYTMAGVQAQLDMQRNILCQYKAILEEQGRESYLTIPRQRNKDIQEGLGEKRRLETESLKNFKMMMDKRLHQKNVLFNICDV